jgi:hypothetical protein
MLDGNHLYNFNQQCPLPDVVHTKIVIATTYSTLIIL